MADGKNVVEPCDNISRLVDCQYRLSLIFWLVISVTLGVVEKASVQDRRSPFWTQT